MFNFTAPSGARVELTISDYSTCVDLLRAVRRVTQQDGRQIENVDILIDPEVDRLIYKCMERATYTPVNGTIEKISRATFEPEDRRCDFLPVASEVMAQNLNPFVSHLLSGSEDTSRGTTSSPASK